MNIPGSNIGLGKSNIVEAFRNMQERGGSMQVNGANAEKASFAPSLSGSITKMDQVVQATNTLPLKGLQGEMDFHEVAAKMKQAQLSFEFTMQVRNKFIDAYREVMRMTV